MLGNKWSKPLIAVWTGCVLLFLYIPIATVFVVAFSNSSYFTFPVKAWSLRWFHEMLQLYILWNYHLTSLSIALDVMFRAEIGGPPFRAIMRRGLLG